MWKKGSITIFYSLILSVLLALMGALLLLAKISAGRTHTAMAMDQVMFSQMAKYDQALLEEYHLFFMDGGYGKNTLQTGKILDEIESELSYVLMPSKEKSLFGAMNFLDLTLENSGITGYTLATDQKGSVFREQIIQYMKDTLVLQNISSMVQGWNEGEHSLEKMESLMETLEETSKDFSLEMLETNTQQPEEGTETAWQEPPVPVSLEEEKKAKETKELLKSVQKAKRSRLLDFVLKTPESLSEWAVEKNALVSERKRQKGMGVIEFFEEENKLSDTYLFQEYLLRNINCYGNELHKTGPSYGLEYIIGGKPSDAENLEYVVKQLLLVREAANAAHLYGDAQKRAAVESAAMLVAAVFMIPEFQGAVESALILAWAYVESLVDVRGLLSGKAVPLMKNSSGWQVSFENIPLALTDPDCLTKSSGTTYYKDYLKYLLLPVSDEKETMRCMDVVEQTLRGLPGKENFSLDCAVDTLEVAVSVTSEKKKELEIVERRSYRTM